MPSLDRSRKLHYAWIIAIATFATMILSAGVRSVPSIIMVPLEHEFGWDRATISAAASLNIFLFGMLGPFVAGLMNRFGVRRVIILSLATSGTGVALSLLMKTPLQLIMCWGILVGIGTGMTSVILGATVAGRWFHTHRGLVLGALTGANATGQLIFLPLLAKLIERENDWRAAVRFVLYAILAAAPVIWLLMRDSPRAIGIKPFGYPEDQEEPEASKENPIYAALRALKVGVRSKDFWLLAGSFFICGASTNGLVGTHLVPACIDHGIPEVKAAGLLALMGVFDLVGTTASGWLSDRFPHRWLLFMYYGLRGLSLVFLPHALQPESTGLTVFAIFYGLDWIATVPPTVGLAAQIFGREKAAVMFGWIMVAHQMGAAGIAFFAGFLRTHEGNYDHAFLLAGSACILTAFAVLLIGRGQRVPSAAVAAV